MERRYVGGSGSKQSARWIVVPFKISEEILDLSERIRRRRWRYATVVEHIQCHPGWNYCLHRSHRPLVQCETVSTFSIRHVAECVKLSSCAYACLFVYMHAMLHSLSACSYRRWNRSACYWTECRLSAGKRLLQGCATQHGY